MVEYCYLILLPFTFDSYISKTQMFKKLQLYLLLAWAVATNSTSNKEFLVKTLEDKQKSLCCIYQIDKHTWFHWSLCDMKIYQSKLNGGSKTECAISGHQP